MLASLFHHACLYFCLFNSTYPLTKVYTALATRLTALTFSPMRLRAQFNVRPDLPFRSRLTLFRVVAVSARLPTRDPVSYVVSAQS